MYSLLINQIVAKVAELVRQPAAVRVFAVWPDGEVTEEGFGFRGVRRPDGSLEEPVATFVSGARLSPDKIRARIERGARSRGL